MECSQISFRAIRAHNYEPFIFQETQTQKVNRLRFWLVTSDENQRQQLYSMIDGYMWMPFVGVTVLY